MGGSDNRFAPPRARHSTVDHDASVASHEYLRSAEANKYEPTHFVKSKCVPFGRCDTKTPDGDMHSIGTPEHGIARSYEMKLGDRLWQPREDAAPRSRW
jgi:hypothetical protein